MGGCIRREKCSGTTLLDWLKNSLEALFKGVAAVWCMCGVGHRYFLVSKVQILHTTCWPRCFLARSLAAFPFSLLASHLGAASSCCCACPPPQAQSSFCLHTRRAVHTLSIQHDSWPKICFLLCDGSICFCVCVCACVHASSDVACVSMMQPHLLVEPSSGSKMCSPPSASHTAHKCPLSY